MATTEEIRSELAEIVNEVTGIPADDVQLDKSFTDDLDVDSLSMVEVVVAAEEKFSVRIPDDAVKDLKTVGDAVSYIEKAQAARLSSPPREDRTMSRRRVVVTGLGTTSPVGGDVASTWEALVAGKSGVRHLDRGLGAGPPGPDRRDRSRRPDRRARPGQGPPARPVGPVRHGRGHGGLGRLRARRRRTSTTSGSASRSRPASAASPRCWPTTTRSRRRARAGSPRSRCRC